MQNKRYHHKLSSSKGFTLIEIMVVVVILGILATFVVPKIFDRPDQAREVRKEAEIKQISAALELYRLDNGFYPTTQQGLQALVSRPQTDPAPKSWQGYLQNLPEDPWGNLYCYKMERVRDNDLNRSIDKITLCSSHDEDCTACATNR